MLQDKIISTTQVYCQRKSPQKSFFRLLNSDLANDTVLYEVSEPLQMSLGVLPDIKHLALDWLYNAQKTSCKNIIGNFGSDI